MSGNHTQIPMMNQLLQFTKFLKWHFRIRLSVSDIPDKTFRIIHSGLDIPDYTFRIIHSGLEVPD